MFLASHCQRPLTCRFFKIDSISIPAVCFNFICSCEAFPCPPAVSFSFSLLPFQAALLEKTRLPMLANYLPHSSSRSLSQTHTHTETSSGARDTPAHSLLNKLLLPKLQLQPSSLWLVSYDADTNPLCTPNLREPLIKLFLGPNLSPFLLTWHPDPESSLPPSIVITKNCSSKIFLWSSPLLGHVLKKFYILVWCLPL